MPATLMVFSHPNHEIAVLGAIKRMQPHVVFLTDGGSPERMAETRAGLADYLPADKLTFLGRREEALYEGLLDGNAAFYRKLASEVAGVIHAVQPQTVYCDTVEFYNPVHDMALPVVRRAVGGARIGLFEVPLIYQKAAPQEAFEVQRVPPALVAESITIELSAEELAQKTATLQSGVYRSLLAQMGQVIQRALPTHAGKEQFLKARTALPVPQPGQALRYDARGKTLVEDGKIARNITFQNHYAPMFEALGAA